MKYPIIFKHVYSYKNVKYTNEEVVNEYYQIFFDKDNFKFLTFDERELQQISILNIEMDEITILHKFQKYTSPPKSEKYEEVSNKYTINDKKPINIETSNMGWIWGEGYINSHADLKLSIISLKEMVKEVLSFKNGEDKIKTLVDELIKDKIYGVAYNLLKKAKINNYHLGLCYEKGYGCKKDLTKAHNIYLSLISSQGYYADRSIEGLERIYKLLGKEKIINDITKTVLFEEKEMYIDMYKSAHIPLKFDDSIKEEARRNVEISIVMFLELGRPSNDPFYHHTHDMEQLATYFDVINNVPPEKRKKYYKCVSKKDEYDKGTRDVEIFLEDLIIENFQKQAKTNDVIALGVLLNQYPDKIDNKDELINRLKEVICSSCLKQQGLAYYFLGLYYEREENNLNESYKCFKKALELNVYVSAAHLIDYYLNMEPTNTFEKLSPYKKYFYPSMSTTTSMFFKKLNMLNK